jgi:hypothetical protein
MSHYDKQYEEAEERLARARASLASSQGGDAWPRDGRQRRAENLAMLPAFGGGLEARVRHSLRVGVTDFNVSLRWLGDNDATYQEKLDRVVYLYGLFVQFQPGYEPTEIIFRAVEF